VTQLVSGAEREWSALAEFDAGEVLDGLSLGILVLDSQLCTVYANVKAEDALALEVQEARGRPLPMFLPQPQRFVDAVGLALQKQESVYCDLPRYVGQRPDAAGSVLLRVSPLGNHVTGAHFLVEVSMRQRVESQRARQP